MLRLTQAEIQIIIQAIQGKGHGYGPKPVGPLQAKLSIMLEVASKQGDPLATDEEIMIARNFREGKGGRLDLEL